MRLTFTGFKIQNLKCACQFWPQILSFTVLLVSVFPLIKQQHLLLLLCNTYVASMFVLAEKRSRNLNMVVEEPSGILRHFLNKQPLPNRSAGLKVGEGKRKWGTLCMKAKLLKGATNIHGRSISADRITWDAVGYRQVETSFILLKLVSNKYGRWVNALLVNKVTSTSKL